MPRAVRLVLSIGLPTALASLAIAAGCNGVQTNNTYYQPDASNSGCSSQPEIQCDAVPASTQSCTGNPSARGNEALLPLDASFPANCQAYLRGSDCSSEGYCTCDGADDSGAPAAWNCHDGIEADGGS